MPAKLILVMGVSGTGKSTIAQAIAQQLDYHYLDADEFHSEQAKRMMAAGQAINDTMRNDWIESMLFYLADEQLQKQTIVLAYSGLKKLQRMRFNLLDTVLINIFLNGTQAVISERLTNRAGHFFPETLLNSQFEALELPQQNSKEQLEMIDIDQPITAIVEQAVKYINQTS